MNPVKSKFKKDVVTKAMDYLAMRDHSRKELHTKLKRLEYSDEEIEYALNSVQERGWLLAPEELSKKVAQQLHKKNKSHFYINQYLLQKDLPPVEKEREIEYEKALKLARNKLSSLSNASFEDKQKVARSLQNRGFDGETISRLINETRKN